MSEHHAMTVSQTVPLGHDHSTSPFQVGDRVTYKGAIGTVYCAREYPFGTCCAGERVETTYQRIAVEFDPQSFSATGERITHAEGASEQFETYEDPNPWDVATTDDERAGVMSS